MKLVSEMKDLRKLN